jgi:hypothetical protein
MSKFKTSIPVDLAAIKNALPPRSFVSGVHFDGERVTLEWENDDYKTPYTVPVEWSDLNSIPAGVKPPQARVAPAKTPEPEVELAPVVSGQQTSSPSQPEAKPDDAPTVKKQAVRKK